MRLYVYVDGESHYERTVSQWKKLKGPDAALAQISVKNVMSGGASYPDHKAPYIRILEIVKFFWDTNYSFIAPHPFGGYPIDGATYFTSFSGNDDDYHQACIDVRKQRFEPRIVHELKQHADRRTNKRTDHCLIEKPKGVDIGLTVRVLEDAYHNIFDVCFLFTSDIDFLPVIQVVQRLGKKVVLFGYADGIGNRSKLEYVPDAFVDLSERMKSYEHPHRT